MKTPRLPRFAAAATAVTACLLLGLTLSGCARTTVASEQPLPTAFDGPRTYAWVGNPPQAGRVGFPETRESVAAEFRRALDGELGARGFEKVSEGRARFRAGLYLGIEKDTRTSDPQFTVYPAERIERGHATLTLTLTEAPGPEAAWVGTASRVLRVTELGMGQTELRWTGTEETRDWRVTSLASSLGSQLP